MSAVELAKAPTIRRGGSCRWMDEIDEGVEHSRQPA
jgi:hypothetical protein